MLDAGLDSFSRRVSMFTRALSSPQPTLAESVQR